MHDLNRYRKVYPFYRSSTASLPAPCCELNLTDVIIGDYTAKYSDFVRVDPVLAGTPITITLPTAGGEGTTKAIAIKNITSSENAITIEPQSSELIDNQSEKILLKPYECVTLLSDGTGWWIYSNHIEYSEYWASTQEGAIFTTGSVAIRGLEVGIDAPSDKGSDVFFYVSGSVEAENSQKSLFGGTLYVSGTFIQGLKNAVGGQYSMAAGEKNIVNGATSQAFGYQNSVYSEYSFAVGKNSIINNGANGSISIGNNLFLNAPNQIVLGKYNTAGGNASATLIIGSGVDDSRRRDVIRVEASSNNDPGYDRLEITGSFINGVNCVVGPQPYNHAEGIWSKARGAYSHAEGIGSITSIEANGAHASGYYVVASGSTIGQNVIGKYNKLENDFSLFVVGNGTSEEARSDILRVNQSLVEITGSLSVTTDVIVDGNLLVAGEMTVVDTQNLVVKDPVIGLGFSDVNPVDGDRGFINSNSAKNTALFWDNSDSRFVAAYTLDTPESIDSEDAGATINIDSYADMKARVFTALGGFSGSLTTLSNGNPYIVSGINISTTTGSVGDVMISTSILPREVTDVSLNNFTTIKSNGILLSEPNLTFDKFEVSFNNSKFNHGYDNITDGFYSHAEGWESESSGEAAHAEGYRNHAKGQYSHAEGYGSVTSAEAIASHVSGRELVASGSNNGQNVVGKYNELENDFSLFIVGDGTGLLDRHDVFRVNPGRVEVTGSLSATQGLSGSLTKLSDGTTDYLVAGGYITISTSSNGQVVIETNGGTWNELFPAPRLNTTASVAIAGDLGSTYAAQDQGSDTYFFVSGSLDGSHRSVFGGDTVTSGSIYGKNGLEIMGDVLEMTGSLHVTGSFTMTGPIVPKVNNLYTLGTTDYRWAHVYTNDLHLRNDRGDWTIIEERDYLCVVNNITGKKYKMMLEPMDDNN